MSAKAALSGVLDGDTGSEFGTRRCSVRFVTGS